MKVYGDNTNYPFGKYLHDNNFPLEISSLCSISVLGFHSVWTTKEGRAFAFGYNGDFRISETLPNGIFGKEREIVINDKSGNPCKFISAVCGWYYTLYHVLTKTGDLKLVYSHNLGIPLFLNINVRSPIHLFSGYSTAAVIDSEGLIYIINEKLTVKSPSKKIEASSLPNGEKAIDLACCESFIFALGTSGRVFEASVDSIESSKSNKASFKLCLFKI